MVAKLKVFRTAIGFHDAYVAAPSRAAALRAWGADADLFARGMAEQVEDAALTEAPLASPGTVIKVVRGSAADHLRALPADAAPAKRKRAGSAGIDPPARTRTGKAGKADAPRSRAPAPRPSRARLDAAQDAIDALDTAEREALAAIRREEAALADKRRQTEADFDRRRAKLTAQRDTAHDAYRRAMDAWRDA